MMILLVGLIDFYPLRSISGLLFAPLPFLILTLDSGREHWWWGCEGDWGLWIYIGIIHVH